MCQHVPFQFKSSLFGEEIMAMCRVHDIDLEHVVAGLREGWNIVEPGEVDLSRIDIGKRRIVECPSARLDDIIHGAVSGAAFAMGKPLLEDESGILEGIEF